jgi:hypothetical protein
MSDEIEERQEEQISPRDVPNLDPIFDDMQEVANKHNIENFALLFRLPGIDKTLMYWRNENNDHFYDAAQLMASAMRDFKIKMTQELDC